MTEYLKMYIAVHTDVEDFMVPTLVAHTVINAHTAFSENLVYQEWLEKSYRKVVVRVGNREFDKIKALEHFAGYENTQMGAKESCLVALPVLSNSVPNVLKFAKPWAPKNNTNDIVQKPVAYLRVLPGIEGSGEKSLIEWNRSVMHPDWECYGLVRGEKLN